MDGTANEGRDEFTMEYFCAIQCAHTMLVNYTIIVNKEVECLQRGNIMGAGSIPILAFETTVASIRIFSSYTGVQLPVYRGCGRC